jgi:hypothetical protein
MSTNMIQLTNVAFNNLDSEETKKASSIDFTALAGSHHNPTEDEIIKRGVL